jgi:hypothetical protein
VSTRCDRCLCSPRAIVQGWVQSLDTAIADLRKAVTTAKLECMFGQVLEVETMETTIKHRLLEVEDLVSWRDQVSRWKDKVRLWVR